MGEAEGTRAFLIDGGRMGALMRDHDWATTPLGPVGTWPQSLRSAVSIMLSSRYPIALYWGPELALLYNDAWSPIPGGKHPWALGRPGREVWPEIWDTIGPLYSRVYSTGEGVWQEDELLPMNRHGYVEECYYNFTFSPVRGADGEIDGIFNAVVETTDRVLSERRLRTLSRMGGRADPALSTEGACRWAVDMLSENAADVPFALVYLRDGDEARLAAATGVGAGSAAAPLTLSLDDGADAIWPLDGGPGHDAGRVIAPPQDLELPRTAWPEPVSEVMLLPVTTAGEARPSAFLVVGANPRRRIDAGYRSFFELAAGHVGTALSAAGAYAEERRRVEALAELDRAKTQFFSNVSHEFRTPLTLMLGPLEDLLAASPAAGQREQLEVAHRNALRLLRLVNALLDFSRVEAGRIEASYRATDLAGLTADLVSSFRSATERAGLALVVDAPPLSQPAYVDPGMWETIVLNLMSNAFKYTLAGEIRAELREEDGRAVLTVRDTGTGIPASELPKLFDRFHRVEGAQGRSFEGSGIGLALVDELVRRQGGTIAVESQEGRGSAFVVTLPLGAAHLPSDRIEVDAGERAGGARARAFVDEALRWLPGEVVDTLLDPGETPGAFTPPAPGGAAAEAGRVLLADDNADLRDYISRLLAEQGYGVQAVADGWAALDAARARRPDLIVTDVMMPRLDGFGLLRAVREDAELRDLPVILLSARAGEEAKVEGLGAGADDYLTKPFSARELLARIASNLTLARVRREAAEAVSASEARVSGVLEGMAEGFVLLDRDFRILDINAEGLRLEGVERRDVVGRSHWEVWPGAEDAELGLRLKRVMADRTPAAFENHYVWPDGREGWFEVRAYPAGAGLSVFYRDISDRKQAEDRLRELNGTLERRIADAVAEREHTLEALRQAQKMEAMGQLTGGVAHDFNNLLTPIVGALDLLQRKALGGDREQRLILGAMQSADRAKTLVQRLLAFARRQPLQPVAVDVGKLVAGMADLVASTTGPQIKVVVETAERLPPARADTNQLEMALLNLAVNARDAMPEGGVLRISADAATVEQPRDGLRTGPYVRLSVGDTGAGMDEATLKQAVEPFFSTKGIGKGTGLGLSMVHGLASQLGGALLIRSQVGLGTDIELWLPQSGSAVEAGPAVPAASRSPRMRGTALLVDDEEAVRMSTADMLTDIGFSVVEAGSGEEALRLIADRDDFDIVITDHLMPGMTGAELARAVRRLKPGTPLLLISGYAEEEGIEATLPRLGKPFRRDELETGLETVLSSIEPAQTP